MDWNEAWSKIADSSKSAWNVSVNHTAAALDAAAPTFAPFAARWDAEADRRAKLRTPENLKALMDAQKNHTSARSTSATAKAQRSAARKATRNPLAGARRAARTAHKAAVGHHGEAKAVLKTARKSYPSTLTNLAVKAHTAHAVPAGLASWLMSTGVDWTVWPASVSAGLIAANLGSLWLGRRSVAVAVDTDASAEERQLMERLDPAYWVAHADERGLSGTVTTPPQITPAGIVCSVRLDGRWTSAKELRSRSDAVRALLGMRTETRMQVTAGARGDWARLLVRTRSATDGVSMIWTPDHSGIGVDEVTGEIVDLPLRAGVHVLLAGITGMGKSVSWRGLFMRAVLSPDWAPIVIDPKRQEAIGVQHAVRAIGQEPDREQRMADIYAVVLELTREMHRRQGIASTSRWEPDGSPENRLLLVIIDEGAALVRMAQDRRYSNVLTLLEELWSEARSVGFQFVWATQNPTKSGGVPALVKDNMLARISLTTGAGEHERSIFGENAQQEGWTPAKLDGIPGRALVQFGKRKPDPVRMWLVTDDTIAALDSDAPWHAPTGERVPAPAPAGDDRPALRLVKDGPAAEAPAVPDDLTANQRAVLTAVRDGAVSNAEIAKATEMNPGSAARAVKALVKRGLLAKDGSDIREVSA